MASNVDYGINVIVAKSSAADLKSNILRSAHKPHHNFSYSCILYYDFFFFLPGKNETKWKPWY